MNTYTAIQDMIVRTHGGLRVRIEEGMAYTGGLVIKPGTMPYWVLYVEISGRRDEVRWDAGTGWPTYFKFRGHTNSLTHTPVEVVKRARIQK